MHPKLNFGRLLFACLFVLVGVLSQTPSSEDEVFVRKNTDKGKDLLGCGPDESGELKVVR